MKCRHLVTKGFDWGLVSKSLILDNSSMFTKLEKRYGKVDRRDYSDEVVKSFPDKISLGMNLSPVKDFIMRNEYVSDLILDNSEVKSLSDIFSSTDASSILSSFEIDKQLREVAVEMFSGVNPLTNREDVSTSEVYTSSIPIVVITGTFPPQYDSEDNSYFNPEGCVTVAEFLDSLNAIKFGSNSCISRKKSLDNVSDEKDFFNEGYQSCLNMYSSPFYNLYTRSELLQPITRLELAYLTVICWDRFKNKYGSVFTGEHDIGVTFSWNNSYDLLDSFEDGFNYKVSKRMLDDNKILSINIKDYMNGYSITDFKNRIQTGVSSIPYPMFMSLLELSSLDLFYFEGSCLNPMKEVSRGELSYFLVRLASIFGGSL